MKKGWVAVCRGIEDHWLWQDKPFSKGQAWIDLILLADHKASEFEYKGEIVTAERGQVHRSIKYLSERWGWSRWKTTQFVRLLEKEKMVTANLTTHRTTITIENYNIYQDKPKTNQQQANSKPTASQQQANTYNNTNNTNNTNNNIYSVHFEECWSIYPRKKEKASAYKCYKARLKEGYSEQELLSATKNYAQECKTNGTEQKYIKLGRTFYGVNTPFVDYLKKGESNGANTSGQAESLSIVDELVKRGAGDTFEGFDL